MKIDNHAHGKFTAAGEIRFQRMLPGPIERVWTYLVDSEKRSRWLAAGPLEPRVGGKVRLEFDNAKLTADVAPAPGPKPAGSHACVNFTGRVTRCEPPHVLAYTWGESDGHESEVTFELTPQGAGVLLLLVHRKLGDDRTLLTSVAAGWHAHVAVLIARLEGTSVPSYPALHSRLEAEYEKLLSTPRA